ncbi:hypothetical protein VCUG_01358 [Vavraia culicis subsp. floridensis]|uniref:Chromo domain-containing protein n=1 Tax=Vavraia culicis (isolate floridensis) TaxID=948595 RepID=L2GU57_VAVCU|nr:uncharacterized protein VCUG_01358 [Vavraia culicis subsp. floridensis]ELA47169.1 hypothetical protein VCUG_01358 [Vavraia culicis subsp. floridensis]
MSDDNIYQVEKIVDSRIYKGKKQYLIKWEGFPSNENTWEYAKDIFSKELIDQFEEEKKQKKKSAAKPRAVPEVTNEWAQEVSNIENVYMDEKKNRLMVDILFNSGKRMSVDAKTVHQRCPVALLEYYEKNISFTDEVE